MEENDITVAELKRLVIANAKTVSALGARTVVLGKFFDAVLPELTHEQRAKTALSFRESIENVLSLMDDVALPAEYHSTLLEVTNAILSSLNQNFSGGGR